MNENFLINFHRIMVFVRFDIHNNVNSQMIDVLIDVINGNINNDEMCYRLVKIRSDLNSQLIYGDGRCDENLAKINDFLFVTLMSLKECIVSEKNDIAYDISDMLQALPEFEYCSKLSHLRCYWKVYVKKFIKKWKYKSLNRYKYIFTKKR